MGTDNLKKKIALCVSALLMFIFLVVSVFIIISKVSKKQNLNDRIIGVATSENVENEVNITVIEPVKSKTDRKTEVNVTGIADEPEITMSAEPSELADVQFSEISDQKDKNGEYETVEPETTRKIEEHIEIEEPHEIEDPKELSSYENENSLPDSLKKIFKYSNINVSLLENHGCEQLITVQSQGSSAIINFYSFENDVWVINEELSCSGYVGENGVTENKREGGNTTPKGLYSISDAFYINTEPDTGLDTFEITEDTYWVDDPDSIYYNRHVEGEKLGDWNSAEHMIDYDTSYEYGFVIDYNTDAVYNAGSAIFFHVSYSPTAGCVGTDVEHVLMYLSVLQSTRNPYILII